MAFIYKDNFAINTIRITKKMIGICTLLTTYLPTCFVCRLPKAGQFYNGPKTPPHKLGKKSAKNTRI